MRERRKLRRRRAAGIDNQHARTCLDALIAGIGRIDQSLCSRVVISKHRGEQIGRRDAHSVEQRQCAVAMAQKPQHRQHAIDRIQQLRRQWHTLRRIGLAQRKKIEQQADQRFRIAADMASIGQDLPIELLAQKLGALAQQRRRAQRAKTEFRKRDRSEKTLLAAHPGSKLMLEKILRTRKTAHEATIEGMVGAFEDHRRLREKGEQAANDDPRFPRGILIGHASVAQKIIDERARIGARKRAVGGPQMPQPAEPVQAAFPLWLPRFDLEWQPAMRIDDFTRESEITGIDVRRDGRIGGAYILRRDQQTFWGFCVDQSEDIGRPAQEPTHKHRDPAREAAKETESFPHLRAVQLTLPSLS